MKKYKVVIDIQIDKDHLADAKDELNGLLEYAMEVANDSEVFGDYKIVEVVEL